MEIIILERWILASPLRVLLLIFMIYASLVAAFGILLYVMQIVDEAHERSRMRRFRRRYSANWFPPFRPNRPKK